MRNINPHIHYAPSRRSEELTNMSAFSENMWESLILCGIQLVFVLYPVGQTVQDRIHFAYGG